jgi:hypothetical protein
VAQKVDLDELLDVNGVADVLGLAHRTVSVYQHRYPDMPRPVLDFGSGRAKIWLKPEIERWAAEESRTRTPTGPSLEIRQTRDRCCGRVPR